MEGRYLHPGKSFIISSPAGSGKTEKLARRYISLLESGAEPEKVLAITFTEKAASEMKERILRIISRESPALYKSIKPRIPLMRISTIHSFCLKLLKRFSLELGLDPNLKVMEEGAAYPLWRDSVSEVLRAEAGSPGLFFRMMKERGIRGWDGLFAHLDEIFHLRPLADLIFEGPLNTESELERNILELYRRCFDVYTGRKSEGRLLDFADLEIYAYRSLASSPEWQNILYSFDEHTDHIMVDEFQDTSSLQWRLIDKLTEEWRSGLGAKRDRGGKPTIFLVGDEKQSIYLFRGADVSVINKAKQRLSEFLGDEYEFEEVKENYRSLPKIIEFTNRLFEKLMPAPGEGSEAPEWRVRYSPFEARRDGQGGIELLLLSNPEGNTKENREREARAVAKEIRTIFRRKEVFGQKEEKWRPCDYSDMAVLLRQRTHLAAFEDALRREKIPFVVLKGMGFYDEPEVALLREFISFIVYPADDYSLFFLLRSPLFGLGYESVLKLGAGDMPLFERLKLAAIKDKKMLAVQKGLERFIGHAKEMPLSMLLETLLEETFGWTHFWEGQRRANVKKFIALIEALEAEGLNPLAIRDKLMSERNKGEVPKANVNAEGMNAVRLMTVHAAKGLQFPIVFLPSLEEDTAPKSTSVVIEEDRGAFSFRYQPDSAIRKEIPEFDRLRTKCLEEEKRLFYVAITRARDFLFLSGFSDKPKGRLAYLMEAFDLKDSSLPFRVTSELELEASYARMPAFSLAEERHFLTEQVYAEPLDYQPPVFVRDVTEDILVKTRHGKDWVLIGMIIHQLLEELSKGTIRYEDSAMRARVLVEGSVFEPEKAERLLKLITGDLEKLNKNGIMDDVVLCRERSFAEFPFVHQRGKTLFNGRMDRVVVKDDAVFIYDYKGFPVKRDSELDELVEKYEFQMELYREAAEALFSLPARAFLVFTHLPLCLEV